MKKITSRPKLNAQILDEASEWFVDFEAGDVDAGGREAFSSWLRTSPEHVRAYLQISAFWQDATLLNKAGRLDAELLARALEEVNVVPLEFAKRATTDGVSGNTVTREDHGDPGDEGGSQQSSLRRFGARSMLAAAASVAALAIGVAMWVQKAHAPTYTTEIGEQRSIVLADGSTVELNSRSRLRVRFTEAQRTVELLEGQALFQVAKNPARPFVVRSGSTSVRAVGTRFDVYRKTGRTVVTVVEGRVAVSTARAQGTRRDAQLGLDRIRGGSASPPAQTSSGTDVRPSSAGADILLAAGEQLTATPEAVTMPQPANLAMATAWTQRKLAFESAPLSEVIEEFNRYNTRPILIEDAQLKEVRVTGEFPSTDADRIIAFLRQRFGVAVIESEGSIRIVAHQTVVP